MIDNGPQFLSQFITLFCGYLSVKHLTTTAHHPHTNGQAKHFNRITVARLRHNLFKHQQIWNLYVQLLSYAYITKARRLTKTSPYSLVLRRHPPRPSLMHASSSTTDSPTLSNHIRSAVKLKLFRQRYEPNATHTRERAKRNINLTTITKCARHHL